MFGATLEIVEYNEKYIKNEQLKDLCYQNFWNQINIHTFNGLYISMRHKYGNFFYIMFIGLLLFSFCIAFLALAGLTQFPTLWVAITSVIISIICNYLVFGVYLVNRNHRTHKGLGVSLFTNFSVNEKYIKKGGTFFLALLRNPNDGSHQVVGHLGCIPKVINNPEDPKKEVKVLYLEVFGVSPAIRGAGIGKKLVEEAINYAKVTNYDGMNLYVWITNTVGQSIYKKFGFKVIDTLVYEPLTGLTRLEMVKMLK